MNDELGDYDQTEEGPRSYILLLLIFAAGLFVGAVGACFALRFGNPWTGTRIRVEPVSAYGDQQALITFEDARRPQVMGDPVAETRPGPRMLVEYGGTASVTCSKAENEFLGLLTMQPSRHLEIQMPASLTSGPMVLTYY